MKLQRPHLAALALLTIVTISWLAGAAPALARAGARKAISHRAIEGAWELVWPAHAEGRRQIKLITPAHFSWSTYDTRTHDVMGSAGGTCTLVGDKYCEQLDFVLGSMTPHAGRVLCFRLEVHGDTLLQVGDGVSAFDDGPREVWRRLR